MRRSARLAIALLAGTAWPFAAAQAAGWDTLPNGQPQFTDRITTTGFFTCGSPTTYRIPGACTANGTSLTLRSGASELTVTFTGMAQTIASSNVRSGPIALGTLSTVVSGAPFTLPPVFSDQAALFTFTLILTGDLGGQARGITSGYNSTAQTALPYNCCEGFATYATLGIPGMPAPLRYSASVYDNFAGQGVPVVNGGTSVITATVGLVPEPSTYALFGAGLVALAAMRRRRARGA